MKRNQIRKLFSVVAIFMVTVMLVPRMAKAEEQGEYVGEVFYSTEYDIHNYWSDGKTPMKEDYVFGGWYRKVDDTYKALTEQEAGVADAAYAKFVPAYVLSVKAQNKYGTNAGTETTSVRIITSVDSKNYQAIGFEVYLANRIPLYKDTESKTPLETTTVYEGILVNGEEKAATEIFGAASEYVGVWKLTDIIQANYSKIIYVRPYWITPDGTTVKGLAKYVHIEDDYEGYISVPVNINRTKNIAAGAINMSYDTGLELAKDDNGDVLFEAGRIFPEMAFNPDGTNKLIKMVGNETDAGIYANQEETIYANIRFKRPTTGGSFNFDMSLVKFCDWDEVALTNGTDVKVWDILYEITATNN